MKRSLSRSIAGTLLLVLATSAAHAGQVPAAAPAPTSRPAAKPSATPTPAASTTPAAPTTSAAAGAMSGESAPSDPMRKLFEDGTADLNAGKFADAAEKLRAVWQQKKTYDVAGNLGAALLQLGRAGEAARYLAHGLASYPAGGKPSGRQRLEELLSDAKGKAAEVRLVVTGGAGVHEVRVDGVAIEAALVGPSLFVEPGARAIEASAKGFVTARATVDAKAGQAVNVKLALVAEQGAGERSMLGPGIAFGVGGAGLVTGVVAAAMAVAKTSDVNKVCGDDHVCPRTERGAVDGATTAAHVSTVGFALAGLGAAVGATLLLVPIGQRSQARAGIVVGPAFVGVKGAF